MDTHKGDEPQSATFETIEPEKDNPARRKFEIGQPGREELQEDERARDESRHIRPCGMLPFIGESKQKKKTIYTNKWSLAFTTSLSLINHLWR
jgi:hypothetical protein